MVFIMDAAAFGRRDVGHEPVSRRRLLQLVGGAGAVAIVSGCGRPQFHSPARPPASPNPAPALQPPSPTTASAVPLSAASAVMLCRDASGARPARAGGRPHTIPRLTFPQEGVVLENNRNPQSRFRQDQRYHQDKLGWVDIAYHV